MILEEVLNKLIRDSVDLILAIPDFSVKAEQPDDAPRPTGAFAAIDFVSDFNLGWEQRDLVDEGDEDLTETISGQREVMMSVNFFNTGARDNARKARTGFVKTSILQLFNAAKVGLVRRSDVRDLTEIVRGTWEPRAQFDLFLNVVGSDSEIIAAILSADIELEHQSGSVIYNATIEVQ